MNHDVTAPMTSCIHSVSKLQGYLHAMTMVFHFISVNPAAVPGGFHQNISHEMAANGSAVPASAPEPRPDPPPRDRLTVHHRNERYFTTRVLQTILKPFKPALVKAGKLSSSDPTRLDAPKAARKRCDVAERKVAGLWVYDLVSKQPNQEADASKDQHGRRMIYFAGGGWQMPPSSQHWSLCAELVHRLPDLKVTIVSIPLAPKYPVSVAFPEIELAYCTMLRDSAQAGEPVIVAGDSSGGNIALCMALWTLKVQNERDVKPPAAILAISPSTDLRHEHPDIKPTDKLDPILTFSSIQSTAKAWCPCPAFETPENSEPEAKANVNLERLDWSFEDPRVSPIKADLSLLTRHQVKLHGVTGSYDVLGPEAVVFRDKCKEEGVEGEWLEWEGQMHCFPLAFRYGLRESKEAMDWIVDVLKE
ncbi:hypothetical protein NM208_g5154 [Fusarium decemcellulare]|uniref:Uncharacterized protein n=1 Tax=Fusarium decemcellulare TaxID=57161 RepID=A0ACC1SI51_9HYPO|nr:hypothetical protein NM208_g5154 [Fusarium decemcellulare]